MFIESEWIRRLLALNSIHSEELLLLAAHKCQRVQEYAIQLSVALLLATLGGILAYGLWLALLLNTKVAWFIVEEEWHV